ncbi:MAG: septum formation inhibitor Maf [Rhodocyclales bacterium]|nr:septum formation inhibitor Maf [Rhodocyclales bacterium]
MKTTMESRIFLASKSPRRRDLLHQIDVRFDLLLFRAPPREDPATDETPQAGEEPEAYARRVACAKAEHAARLVAMRRLVPRLVLAADTTVDVDGDILGKPQDEAAATAMLQRLSGRSHRVVTAVAVASANRLECVASSSEVRFRPLEAEEIRRYVASREPLDKAGAYGIQGRAAIFVEEIRGSHSGIAGLPLCETATLLRKFGYPI